MELCCSCFFFSVKFNKSVLRQAEELGKKLERSRQLVEGLMGEKERWEETVLFLETNFNELPGDCLLGTAFVSYMGPFMSQYREKLLESWKTQVI